jgi:catechol 2,3-dioxygenase-like lactoylglutathione lyase family enzyme
MGMFERAVPILPVRDVDAALAFYERLGFEVRAYEGGGYGYVTDEAVEIHLGQTGEADGGPVSAYLHVTDADAVAAVWRVLGVEVRGPQDTAWGRREGAMVDPDGNVIRFGAPLDGDAAG